MRSTPEKRLQQFEACVFYFSTSLTNGPAAAVPRPANVSRQHVTEPEAIAFHFLAGYDGNFPVEHRPRICKGMEFAIFAAGIDAIRAYLRRPVGDLTGLECQSGFGE